MSRHTPNVGVLFTISQYIEKAFSCSMIMLTIILEFHTPNTQGFPLSLTNISMMMSVTEYPCYLENPAL